MLDTHITIGNWAFTISQQRAVFVTITPEDAAKLLERNTGNRTIKSTHVANLARDMKQGSWVMDGSPIRFDTQGRLLDGQHRLTACIMAGVPFDTVLMTGVSPDAQIIMDTGAKRSAGDMLDMTLNARGAGNSVAAAVRILVGYATEDMTFARITSAEVHQIVSRHPGIIDSAIVLNRSPVECSMAAAFHYVMTADGHPDKAESWRACWADGVPAYADDPAHRLRERLIRERTATMRSPTNLRRSLCLAAYFHFMHSTPIKVLRPRESNVLPGWTLARLGLPERGE